MIRENYICDVEFFKDTNETTRIKWYIVSPKRPVLPYGSIYPHPPWLDDNGPRSGMYMGEPPGVQGVQFVQYFGGGRRVVVPDDFTGNVCGNADQWAGNLSVNNPDDIGSPDCCHRHVGTVGVGAEEGHRADVFAVGIEGAIATVVLASGAPGEAAVAGAAVEGGSASSEGQAAPASSGSASLLGEATDESSPVVAAIEAVEAATGTEATSGAGGSLGVGANRGPEDGRVEAEASQGTAGPCDMSADFSTSGSLSPSPAGVTGLPGPVGASALSGSGAGAFVGGLGSGSGNSVLAAVCGIAGPVYLSASEGARVITYDTASIVSAGSTQGTATAITTDQVSVTTTGSGQGVILPSGSYRIYIKNDDSFIGGNTLKVYPPTGGNLGLGANSPLSLSAGVAAFFSSTDGTHWCYFQFSSCG